MSLRTSIVIALVLATAGCGGTAPTTAVVPTGQTYTLADVAKHATPDDCWLAIDGKAYDLTQWIPHHPGGEQNITNNCGKESSAQFHSKGEKGRDHSVRAEQLLQGYYLGDMKQ